MGIERQALFFDGQDHFFWEIHFPSRLQAYPQIGGGFTDDSARHGDLLVMDGNQQNERFAELGPIHLREMTGSHGIHGWHPPPLWPNWTTVGVFTVCPSMICECDWRV